MQTATATKHRSAKQLKNDKMSTRKMRQPVIDCLVLSTSSGYSTASDEAEPISHARPTTTAALAHNQPSGAQKSSKRKTRAPAAPITPSQKRIKVEPIANYNCNMTSATTPTTTTTAATTLTPPPTASPRTSSPVTHMHSTTVLCSKPPLPPPKTNADISKNKSKAKTEQNNAVLVKKLSAYADQCRLEIADLKLALANEKAAVRGLRAQNDADLRRVKADMLKGKCSTTEKSAVKSDATCRSRAAGDVAKATATTTHQQSDACGGGGTTTTTTAAADAKSLAELKKLRSENAILKDANKQLEEKNMVFCKADRQKTNDVREVKDAYELKISQASKSANVEIHRLLDELKCKDKSLEQLRRDLIHASGKHKATDENTKPTTTPKIRKDKASETKHISSTTFPTISIKTTHVHEADKAHDMHERIHGSHSITFNYCGTKDLNGSDNDSALSSAPPSLSPQPDLFANSQDEWHLFHKDAKALESLRHDFENVQEENQFLGIELNAAKEQIEKLEKSLFESNESSKCDDLYKRIAYLERELEGLQKECYELREQNELLEFRNIELEESYEKSKTQQIPDPTSTDMGRRRMVATVQPYSTISADETDRKLKPNAPVADPTPCTQATQTEPEHFPATQSPAEQTSGDLCAEIQKLNRFRKKIEECVTDKSNSTAVVQLLKPKTADTADRQLQYYKERLAVLENKIVIYESSGDVQMKRLADRLQRELQLESCVKQLTDRVNKLTQSNRQLEEERCELEETENDTRLLLQKLEIEMEMLTQRNLELEVFREGARAHATCLEDTISKALERIQILEEHKSDLKQKLDMLTAFLPSILMLGETDFMANTDVNMESNPINLPNVCTCIQRQDGMYTRSTQYEELYKLMDREKSLKDNIEHLNQVYNETLENADNLWAQMEEDYKQQLAESNEEIMLLKSKIYHLENRLKNDSVSAAERIALLEESETSLNRKITNLSRKQKQDDEKMSNITMEFEALTEKYKSLKLYLNGTVVQNLSKERQKVADLQEELQVCAQAQVSLEKEHSRQLAQLRSHLARVQKELMYINVSNGELKEEVNTLEHRCIELGSARRIDEDTIKNLTYELQCKYDQMGHGDEEEAEREGASLAHELQLASMSYSSGQRAVGGHPTELVKSCISRSSSFGDALSDDPDQDQVDALSDEHK